MEKDLAFGMHRLEDQEFKVILGHTIVFNARLGYNSSM